VRPTLRPTTYHARTSLVWFLHHNRHLSLTHRSHSYNRCRTPHMQPNQLSSSRQARSIMCKATAVVLGGVGTRAHITASARSATAAAAAKAQATAVLHGESPAVQVCGCMLVQYGCAAVCMLTAYRLPFFLAACATMLLCGLLGAGSGSVRSSACFRMKPVSTSPSWNLGCAMMRLWKGSVVGTPAREQDVSAQGSHRCAAGAACSASSSGYEGAAT
jgi:hypothetical protein